MLSSDKCCSCSTAKITAIAVIILYVSSIYFLMYHQLCYPTSNFLSPFMGKLTSPMISKYSDDNSPTKINHLMFGLLASANGWKHRKAYIESWWRPNITRGHLYLDTNLSSEFFPWSQSSPALVISQDISKLVQETNHVAPYMARMVHAIKEIYNLDHEGVRWFVMGDDDSIFFVDNWVDVLRKYDHNKYFYIGGLSESVRSNSEYSFEQGYGGAGFALSYPLAQALANNMEDCLRRYPYLTVADKITATCIADLGVSVTHEKGIHQIDLWEDISGFLSSPPQAPLASLHHIDNIYSIFPSKNKSESVNHLMKAANLDQSRMLQQTICYNRKTNWSISVSWGYSTHIYETIIPRSTLKKPLETFVPWTGKNTPSPKYMFNIRYKSQDPCDAPHVFYLDKVKKFSPRGEIVTTYVRNEPRGLSPCSSEKYSADSISKIQVFSPTTKRPETGRSECCDVTSVVQGSDMLQLVKIRPCMMDEIIR